MSKISVIMPVCLTPYEIMSGKTLVKSASNPEIKFVRAVNSFLNQTYPDKELIVVHDGCERSKMILSMQFNSHVESGMIKSIFIEKQPLYSGKMRQVGIDIAKGNIICYLDSDDYLESHHLSIIAKEFNIGLYDWVYYNDFIVKNMNPFEYMIRDVHPAPCSIGTSSIAHRQNVFNWDFDGYAHDWRAIEKYLIPNPKNIKISTPGYCVCHVSGLGIDC